MAGLRERRHEETRQALVDAAFELFAERGFASVTMDEISRAAGVSRSTAYRRFPTKEELVLEVPRHWLAAFDGAAESLADDTTLAEAIRATCMAVARHIDEDPTTVLRAYAILEESPTLQTSGVATTDWIERMVGVIGRFGDLDVGESRTIAGAYLGAIDATMNHWASSGGTSSVEVAIDQLLRRLLPILS